MQPTKLLVLILLFLVVSCSKKSSNITTFSATLTGTGYNGTATATLDADLLTLNVTHNIGRATISSDGIYNKTTGAQSVGFISLTGPLVSPFTYRIDCGPQSGNPTFKSELMANSCEIRFYTGANIILKGTLIKQ